MERRLLILYGSQTGTAEDLAHQLARGAQRLHLRTQVSSMDQYNRDGIFDEDLVVFICSTTGQGVQPSNMTQFWNQLRRSNLPSNFLDNLRFTVFGLGDSSYPKFNWTAKKLFRRLVQLGATSFYESGQADDQNLNGVFYSVDSTLLPWLDGLWSKLLEISPLPIGILPIPTTTCLPSNYRLEQSTDTDQLQQCTTTIHSSGSYSAILSKNHRLTHPSHFQDTREIILDLEDQSIDFVPGAVCEIWPQNSDLDIHYLFRLMNWDHLCDQVFKIYSTDKNHDLPLESNTLKEIFKTRLDFTSVPNRSFIEWMSHFTTDTLEREKLIEFCSIEGQDDLYDYTKKSRRTILEVLSEFKSTKIPIEYIFDVFPPLRPCQFSIASSSKIFPNQIHLLVAILNYKTRLSVPRKGLCTTWLAGLEIGTRIQFGISEGYVRFPPDPNQAIICIGPGTGIAPFRSLIQERQSLTSELHQPNTLVFFGCRSQNMDFYYRDQWSESVEHGLCQFFWAASRDQDHKRYVQDLIIENSALVWKYIHSHNASIFISGSAGEMPKAVRSALKKICTSQGGFDHSQSDQYIDKLEVLGKLQEDTWS
ncbi:hypothetical protein PSTG_15594 [Puccinia striiformis f. sp. tritici PST-78]|uniref:NADPH-dependent diflavin oxidoreductase 1 n=1 Tax=Puccinia striiformis f. sp. tritici PST-78 TaxID=1165861 RepID=A0A0L0UV85_9BASI|nr:hypothetical protein PSTG_15594 [Puccinia striiformis f. sp. tritici PST-78]